MQIKRKYRRNTIHIMKPKSVSSNSEQQHTRKDLTSGSEYGSDIIQSEQLQQLPVEPHTHQSDETSIGDHRESENVDSQHQQSHPIQRARRETKLPRRLDDYEVY